MGEHGVRRGAGEDHYRAYTKALLEDLQALEILLGEGRIEEGVRRVGAEQEMFLVDPAMHPSMSAPAVLERLEDARFTTELGRFNLECNLEPHLLEGGVLRLLEQELEELLGLARGAAEAAGARVLLAGILPTIRKQELTLDAMTPHPRYAELNRAALEMRGGQPFRMFIKGLDELSVTHDNVMFEACNTSFQVHFQVGAGEFARLYNLAQIVTAPVLAAAVNSPVFLQHRLWSETRVALFQQAVDARSETHQQRRVRPRVSFGEHWVDRSVLEIFREDVARFRSLLSIDLGASPLETLERGAVPPLSALCLHNGTVYRWNRPCYGVRDGVPHLRIENRVIPSGPTILDEVANAAFFFGLMSAMGDESGDVRAVFSFDDAKHNFMAAARYGLKARLRWTGGRHHPADELILDPLLRLAREGLRRQRIRGEDVDRYLGVIEERVRRGRTGAQWSLDSLAAMCGKGRREECFRALTRSMYDQQLTGKPVHTWALASRLRDDDWRASFRTVGQVMTTDLFTVHEDDLVDLAASLMDWEHIRHVPVEAPDGRLVGLVSHRSLLRLLGRGMKRGAPTVAVRDVMTSDPLTVGPRTETLEAIATMRRNRVSCLPVVDADHKLLGIVTERDFIDVAARLFEEKLRTS